MVLPILVFHSDAIPNAGIKLPICPHWLEGIQASGFVSILHYISRVHVLVKCQVDGGGNGLEGFQGNSYVPHEET